MTVKIARAWYDQCTWPRSEGGFHVDCPRDQPAPLLPRRVIDVGNADPPRIVEQPRDGSGASASGPYVALSYCWGGTQKVRLERANLERFKTRGLPVDELALTIRDAIVFTRAMGFRYLWVDALCIVQDDGDGDKAEQLPLMGTIYKQSALTIAAASGDHADAGLAPLRQRAHFRPCPVYSEVCDDGDGDGGHPVFAVMPINTQQLLASRTAIDSRAWIFQEDVLASRTLKFGPEGLRWSCVTFCCSELRPDRPDLHPSFRTDHNLRTWTHRPDWNPSWHEVLDPRRRYFEDWYAAVSHFSLRRLTSDVDRLPAVAGLARWMHTLRGGAYIQGLWKEDLEYGLLWFVTKLRQANPGQAVPLEEWMNGDEHHRVMPASSSSSSSPLPSADGGPANGGGDDGDTTAGPRFLDPDRLSEELFLSVRMNLLSCSAAGYGGQPTGGVPSWSWAASSAAGAGAPIKFLYGVGSLTAQGTPVARCLAGRRDGPSRGEPLRAGPAGSLYGPAGRAGARLCAP